jgi:hypothetical protein
MEVSDQLQALAALLPGEKALGSNWIGGWVCLRTDMDPQGKRKKLEPAENRTPTILPVARRYTYWDLQPIQYAFILINT